MIFRSPHPDVEVPDRSLTELLLERIAPFGDKPALVDGPTGRTLTYAGLAAAIDRVAAGLARRGFAPGDVMAVFSPNVPEYCVALHAVSLLGGVNTTVNPLYTVEELTFQLRDAGAKWLLTLGPFLDKARAAAEAAGGIREVFVFGEAEGATPFAELAAGDGGAPAARVEPAEDLVFLPYSSGTTGVPKGVMLTHRNVVANLVQLEGLDSEVSIRAADTLVGVLPFFHIYGLVLILNYSLMQGATIVTMPRFDLEQFLATLQDHRVTAAHLVPPIVLALAKHPMVDDYDLSALRVTLCGAAPLGEELSRAFTARLGVPVLQGYGLTEASPVTHVSLHGSDAAHVPSSGPALPSTEVKVLDVETGAALGPEDSGEVCIRGPQVMKGYLNNPEATAATLDDDGWLHTGDIGYVDETGYIYLADRLKELIKYKGFQVAPAELEALLLSHPAVGDAAVVPSPDEEAGEVPKAYVVRTGDVTADAVMAFVAGHVAPHKKIRRLEFVDEIPKSPSGKILRRVLVQRERARA